MKKNIFILIITAAIILMSCGKKDTYKMHQRVGEKYEDGVIFYVSEDESYALICAFTDLQKERNNELKEIFVWDLGGYRWSFFDRDTVLQKDTVWNVTSPTDSTIARIDSNWFYGFMGATSDDNGVENTDKIVDPTKYPKSSTAYYETTAAKRCRDYYCGIYSYRKSQQALSDWAANKGQWYLPSIQELRYLAYAKDKINELRANDTALYPEGRFEETVSKIYRYGWEPLMNCYWSSTERNAQMAYYKCVDGKNQPESYDPKNNSTFILSVRPIRKVMLR